MYKTTYYKNNDFTARRTARQDGSDARYFIRFHGVEGNTPEIELDLQTFTLYATEFHWTLEKDRDEKRRHIEEYDDIGVFGVPSFEPSSLAWIDIAEILKTCTAIQRDRFYKYFVQGHSFAEIARIEDCTERAVRKSIEAVKEKIENLLAD